jgi:hypothetical protein
MTTAKPVEARNDRTRFIGVDPPRARPADQHADHDLAHGVV